MERSGLDRTGPELTDSTDAKNGVEWTGMDWKGKDGKGTDWSTALARVDAVFLL